MQNSLPVVKLVKLQLSTHKVLSSEAGEEDLLRGRDEGSEKVSVPVTASGLHSLLLCVLQQLLYRSSVSLPPLYCSSTQKQLCDFVTSNLTSSQESNNMNAESTVQWGQMRHQSWEDCGMRENLFCFA